MARLALSEILGTPVTDPGGRTVGRVREVVLTTQDSRALMSGLVVQTAEADILLPAERITGLAPRAVRAGSPLADLPRFSGGEGMLLLERDLLDQQVIDVHGRKVVRVNDVEFEVVSEGSRVEVRVEQVDIGLRGAVRRLLKGLVPSRALQALVEKLPARGIPWHFVDLIETDPARVVKLKISHERLAKLHPADIADILEDLSPAERKAIFGSLEEEIAADTLAEIDPKLQAKLVEALDHDRAADIMEEMDPDAAADLLGDLPPETSEEILEEMEPEERRELSGLLEFEEDTAAGRMTTDFLSLPPSATVGDAIHALRSFEGGIESTNTIFLLDDHRLVGAVSLIKLVLAPSHAKLAELTSEPLVSCAAGAGEQEVAELFDKYNLLTLPVVDEHGNLTGVITSDDVISVLRSKL